MRPTPFIRGGSTKPRIKPKKLSIPLGMPKQIPLSGLGRGRGRGRGKMVKPISLSKSRDLVSETLERQKMLERKKNASEAKELESRVEAGEPLPDIRPKVVKKGLDPDPLKAKVVAPTNAFNYIRPKVVRNRLDPDQSKPGGVPLRHYGLTHNHESNWSASKLDSDQLSDAQLYRVSSYNSEKESSDDDTPVLDTDVDTDDALFEDAEEESPGLVRCETITVIKKKTEMCGPLVRPLEEVNDQFVEFSGENIHDNAEQQIYKQANKLRTGEGIDQETHKSLLLWIKYRKKIGSPLVDKTNSLAAAAAKHIIDEGLEHHDSNAGERFVEDVNQTLASRDTDGDKAQGKFLAEYNRRDVGYGTVPIVLWSGIPDMLAGFFASHQRPLALSECSTVPGFLMDPHFVYLNRALVRAEYRNDFSQAYDVPYDDHSINEEWGYDPNWIWKLWPPVSENLVRQANVIENERPKFILLLAQRFRGRVLHRNEMPEIASILSNIWKPLLSNGMDFNKVPKAEFDIRIWKESMRPDEVGYLIARQLLGLGNDDRIGLGPGFEHFTPAILKNLLTVKIHDKIELSPTNMLWSTDPLHDREAKFWEGFHQAETNNLFLDHFRFLEKSSSRMIPKWIDEEKNQIEFRNLFVRFFGECEGDAKNDGTAHLQYYWKHQ
eukprot:g865.t1